jgi:hypothetical protein
MKARIYIADIHSEQEKWTVKDTNDQVKIASSHSANTVTVITASSFQCCLFLIELQNCPAYRNGIVQKLRHHPAVLIRLHPTPKEVIDSLWFVYLGFVSRMFSL